MARYLRAIRGDLPHGGTVDDVIREAAFAGLLRINAEVLAKWRRANSETVPAFITTAKGIFYPHSSADTWLEQRCSNTTPRDVPTVQKLLDGSIRLLRASEVLARLNEHRTVSESLMWLLVKREAWPKLVIPGGTEHRYFEHHIDEVSQPRPDIRAYTVKEVEHILGLGNTRVFKYLADGELDVLPSSGGSPRLITEESLVTLLRTMLPPGYSPYSWIRLRTMYRAPMISPHKAGIMLGVSGARVRKMIAAGMIPALTSGREQRIPIEAVDFLEPHMPVYRKKERWGRETNG